MKHSRHIDQPEFVKERLDLYFLLWQPQSTGEMCLKILLHYWINVNINSQSNKIYQDFFQWIHGRNTCPSAWEWHSSKLFFGAWAIMVAWQSIFISLRPFLIGWHTLSHENSKKSKRDSSKNNLRWSQTLRLVIYLPIPTLTQTWSETPRKNIHAKMKDTIEKFHHRHTMAKQRHCFISNLIGLAILT